MPNYVLGKDCGLYVDADALTSTSSATALGSSTEILNVGDVTSDVTKETVELRTRENGGYKQTIGTVKNVSVKFKMTWKPGDANFELIRDAFLENTEISAWVLDGKKTVTGGQGPAGNWNVISFTRSEPISGVLEADIELSPSSFTHWFIKA